MQGKQYVLGKARTINGIKFESADVPLKLLDEYNCYHYKTPIICGISEPRYSDKELAELKKRDEQTYNIDGHEMTGYEASQAMRRIETGVREQNSMKAMYQASGNTAAVKKCNERIKRYQDKYKEISGITGIAQDKKCMTLTGADKIKSTSTSKAVKTIDNSDKSDIINNIKSKQGVQDVHYIGKIDKNILEKEFGKINTSEVVLTDERKLHIQERHPNDYAIFEKHSNDIITKPDIMLKDSKNENTVFAIKHIEDTNLNIIVKLSIGDDTKHPKNSIMSAYRIRDKNVKKLIKKNKVLYKSE